jgi:hypothetical protein
MKIGGGMRGLKNSAAPHSMVPMARNWLIIWRCMSLLISTDAR